MGWMLADGSEEAKGQLSSIWWLVCLCQVKSLLSMTQVTQKLLSNFPSKILHDFFTYKLQVSNSIVFTYDGILQASAQFRFIRDVLVSGTLLVFTPALAVGYGVHGTLVGVWSAKIGLNLWRCSWWLYRVHVQLWPTWGGKDLWKDAEGGGDVPMHDMKGPPDNHGKSST